MRTRILTVSVITEREASYPFIRLKGRWLAEAGFHWQDQISVTVKKSGVLVIEKVRDRNERRVPS